MVDGIRRKPILYEINARVWIEELSRKAWKNLTLADVPEEEIEAIGRLGANLVWLMGVWRTGEEAVRIARTHPNLDAEYRLALPDVAEAEIVGSPYSVAEYSVSERLGGTDGLLSFRRRLADRGIGLILDFVPNHTGIDHAWTTSRPDVYVQGDDGDLEREPWNFFERPTAAGKKILAHGKDPYFPGWTDTAQVNFLAREAREALTGVLLDLSSLCDGLRCDMAMLALDDVFRRVWGDRAARTARPSPARGEFWADATAAVRAKSPGFLFIAEAYWGLEGRLLEVGFDYAYDKTLYDLLRHGRAQGIRIHLDGAPDLQSHLVRFIENHDECRAAAAFPLDRHRAAILVAATIPGMFLLHEGEVEGRKVRIPVQLGRRPDEPVDGDVRSFYIALLDRVRDPVLEYGRWRNLPVHEAWKENPSWENFIAHEWEGPEGGLRVIAVNFAPHPGQCYLTFGRKDWKGKQVAFTDLLEGPMYTRDGNELIKKGLYLDLPPYGHHLFKVTVS